MNEDTKINEYWNEWENEDEWILEWTRIQRWMNIGINEDTKMNKYWMNEDTKMNEYCNEWGYKD